MALRFSYVPGRERQDTPATGQPVRERGSSQLNQRLSLIDKRYSEPQPQRSHRGRSTSCVDLLTAF